MFPSRGHILGALCAALTMMGAASLHAEGTTKDLIAKVKQGDPAAISALAGISIGFGWANTELLDRGMQQLYCQPPNLALTYPQTLAILEAFVGHDQKSLDLPAGFILLEAMKFTFPCPR